MNSVKSTLSEDVFKKCGKQENIIAGLSGKRIPFPVNPEVYDEGK